MKKLIDDDNETSIKKKRLIDDDDTPKPKKDKITECSIKGTDIKIKLKDSFTNYCRNDCYSYKVKKINLNREGYMKNLVVYHRVKTGDIIKNVLKYTNNSGFYEPKLKHSHRKFSRWVYGRYSNFLDPNF